MPPFILCVSLALALSGTYLATTGVNPPWYVASVTAGGEDLSTHPHTLVEATSVRPILVALGADSITLQGNVRDGGHPAQAYIYAISLHPSTSAPPSTISRPDGTYTLPGIPPGDYRIVASVYPEQIPYREPEALKPWLRRGRPLTVAPDSTPTLDLQVEPYD